MRKSSLRPDLQRTFDKIDGLPDRSVVIDKHGDAWQYSGYLTTWYRAFDGDGHSSWDVAQFAGDVTVLHEGRKR